MTEDEIREGLDRWFGHDDFRPGQFAPVEAVVNGRDAVVVMPTGAGKSLCFQLAALLLPGVTVVVSPLIALMRDQVAAPGRCRTRFRKRNGRSSRRSSPASTG